MSHHEVDAGIFEIPKPRAKREVGKKPIIKAVKDPGKFIERREKYATDEKEYSRDGNEPGVVLIFNQENFDDEKTRKGSRRDVNELIVCFQRQGYNITEDHVCIDFTKEEVIQKLTEVANNEELLSAANSLIVIFMTHGEGMETIHTADGKMRTSDVWGKFSNCEKLKKKPKLFIFQACKGKGAATLDGEKTSRSEELTEIPNVDKFTAQLKPDMLVVYSTLEGNVSFRNPFCGSWFIQELCKNITSHGRRDDIVSLLIRTTKCVAGNYYYQDGKGVQKQMPVFVSTLKRKFYLNRNKDRGILLQIKKNTDEILDALKHIEDKIEKLSLKTNGKK